MSSFHTYLRQIDGQSWDGSSDQVSEPCKGWYHPKAGQSRKSLGVFIQQTKATIKIFFTKGNTDTQGVKNQVFERVIELEWLRHETDCPRLNTQVFIAFKSTICFLLGRIHSRHPFQRLQGEAQASRTVLRCSLESCHNSWV